ncbi:MAG: IPT/TIG domain-containing protein, partial [Deltaproteobacteria bacterium]
VVDLDPFVEDDGIPILFEITEDTGGGAYLGAPGSTTLLTWVNSPDPLTLNTGTVQAQLTLGSAGTVRVVAYTRLLTNPPVWDNVLQTLQADFTQITVTANIQITSPANGATLCPVDDISPESGFQTDVTIITTAYEGSTLSLLIDGFTTATAPVHGGIHTFTSISITEGPHTLVASALGDYSPPNTIIVDLSPPTMLITSPSSGDCINNSIVTIDGTIVDDGSEVALITIRAGTYSATGTSFPIALNVPVDGNYSVIVRAEDNCGNISTPYARNITIDATPLSITLISPTNGPDTGGIEVVIEGSGFAGIGPVSSVTFGGVMATGFTVDSDTRITATIPSATAGAVDVVISDDCGNTYTCINCFEYLAPVYYAVILGDPSDVSISSITVAPNSKFQVMLYGGVLIGGQISPDLGGPYGAESLGAYDFRLRHEVSYLTVNGITETGISCPDPGCEFDDPLGILSNTDEGDGYATSSFNDMNNGGTGFTGPTGIEIPLAILDFTAADNPGTTVIYISDVIDYQSNTPNPLDTAPRRALTVNIIPQNYAVSVGSLTSAAISSITVAPYSTFSVMVYGSVLINGEVSPDLGFGAESLGLYDFRLRHEVASLTINGITGSGMPEPMPGYEFKEPVGTLSNTNDGDGYATSSFNDFNQGVTFTTPTGTDIPLAVVTFSAGTLMGPTTIYISEVLDYQSNNFELLDKTPRKALRVNIAPRHYAVSVGSLTSAAISSITVAPYSTFSVRVYGSVLIDGEVSPDLGLGAESLGAYDFNLRHEVAYLTINGLSGSGEVTPNPGCEFTNPLGTLSNTDEGDNYATSTFNDINNGVTTLIGPVGTDIPLATMTFSAGTLMGPTTIYISEVLD